MKKLTFDFIKEQFELAGFTMLSTEYVGATGHLNVICSKGHNVTMCYSSIKTNCGCKQCYNDKRTLTVDKVAEMALKDGYILISTTIPSSRKKIKLNCHEHGDFSVRLSNFTQGQRCSKCSSVKCGKSQRHAYNDVKNYIETNTPYKLISKEYLGSNEKLTLECQIHGMFKIQYYVVKRGSGCYKCGVIANRHAYNDVKNYIETNTPYKLISKEYLGIKVKLEVKCSTHGTIKMTYESLRRGSKCKKCADFENGEKQRHTYNDVKNYIETNTPYKLTSTKYFGSQTKITLECKIHGMFKAQFISIKTGHGCARCGFKRSAEKQRLDIKQVKNYIEKNTPYKLISTVYINNNTKLDIECPKHGVFKAAYGSVGSGSGCAKCAQESTESKGERQCREIFQRLTGKSFINIRPDFLKNPSTGYNLELDGYCDELKMAFEFDGRQHFEAIEYFGGESNLTKTQALDTLKDTLCINNRITLHRIPYTVSEDDLEAYIANLIAITE